MPRASRTDLLDALNEARQTESGPDDAHTAPELARATGTGINRVRDALRDMLASGQVERVEVRREGLDGRLCRVTAYRLRG